MDIDNVRIPNPYTHHLGAEYFAVDATGEPVARAKTLGAVQRAAPEAAGYFTTDDFWPIVKADNLPHPAAILDMETHGAYIYVDENRKVLSTGYYNYTKPIPAPPDGLSNAILGNGDTDLPEIGSTI